MIQIARPQIGEEEKRAVLEVLESGQLAQGKKVEEFEKAFAEFIGVKHAIATSSGTTALHTTLLAHNIGPGDEVITSPFTFIATANVIKMTGARPIFVDIDEKSFNINPELIEAVITPKTRAIMPVHLFGRAAQMDRIQALADEYDLVIIEDACQAHGAEFNGKKAGSFGTSCFSFYPTKNITTGEGGIITTNNEGVANKARKIINHGSSKKYFHELLGYNYRMTDIAAAIGLEQLKKLDSFNKKRKGNALYLHEKLDSIKGLILPEILEGHVFHQYVVRIAPEFRMTREELIQFLAEKEISSSVFYPLPVHKQEAYAEYNQQEFQIAEKLSKEALSLPVHPGLTEDDLNSITKAFDEVKNG